MKPHKVKGVRKPFSLMRDKGGCLRFDCSNRDIKCGECFRINGKDTQYAKKL